MLKSIFKMFLRFVKIASRSIFKLQYKISNIVHIIFVVM